MSTSGTTTSKTEVGAFGAAFDILPLPEKAAMKAAYVNALRMGRVSRGDLQDPYDALLPLLASVTACGKVPIASAHTSKPAAGDLPALTPAAWRAFLDAGGAAAYVGAVREYVCAHVLPRVPLLLGVDHALTAGVVQALAAEEGAGRLGLVVFDGHLDAYDHGHGQPYGCQNFLQSLAADGVLDPANLVVAGVYRKPDAALRATLGPAADAYLAAYDALVAAGAQVLERDELAADPGSLDRALARLAVDRLYVSLDLDVCASERVPAVRFHDSVGLTPGQFAGLAGRLRAHLDRSGVRLAGLDVMELDVHLLGEEETLEVACRFVETLLPTA
jgi:arginase family enzyme